MTDQRLFLFVLAFECTEKVVASASGSYSMSSAFAKPIIITNAHDLYAVLAEANTVDVSRVVLRTSPEALRVWGVDYWMEVLAQARRRYVAVDFVLYIDAGDTAGRIMKAISAGLSPLVCDVADEALHEKLSEIAAANHVELIFSHALLSS